MKSQNEVGWVYYMYKTPKKVAAVVVVVVVIVVVDHNLWL